MRNRILMPVLIAVLAVGWTASSSAERVIKDGLELTFNASFAPRVLPRDRPAPVDVKINGKIATTDGSHPPPLRWLEVALNRNGQVNGRGLPICAASNLQSTSSETALDRCRGALVGRGSFRALVKLGREIPTGGKIFAFNSRKSGKQALILHLFAKTPVRFTLVVPMTIGRSKKGQFGTILRAKVPKLGGDLGSVTEIDLTIGRRYSFGGKRLSYVSAACAAPAGLTEVPFSLALGTFRFQGHGEIRETLSRTCRVR